VAHVTPPLLPDQRLIDVDLFLKADVFLHVVVDVAAAGFPDDDEEVSHGSVPQQKVRLPGVAVVPPELDGCVEFHKVESEHGSRVSYPFLSEAHGANPDELVNFCDAVGETHPSKAKYTFSSGVQQPKTHHVINYLYFGLENH